MALKVNFDLPAKMSVEIPVLKEDESFDKVELDMSARLVKASEGEEYFAGDEETKIRDVLAEHVKSPPQILKEDDEPYTLEELMDIPYIRNAMYTRLIEVSFNPQVATGNSKPQ